MCVHAPVAASSVPRVVLFSLISFMLFCVVVTVSYCCAKHMTSSIYCCVISVIVIHSYKIPPYVWNLAYHRCMYVAIISSKICLSINDINVLVNESKRTRKVDLVVGCSIDGSTVSSDVMN